MFKERNAIDAFFDDNEFALRKARNKSSNVTDALSLKRSAYYSLAVGNGTLLGKSTKCTNDAKFFFYLVFSNMREAAKSVRYSLDQAVNHVANRHTIFEGVMKESLYELIRRLEKLTEDLKLIETEPNAEHFEAMVKHCKKLNRDIDKCQLELVAIIGREHVSMHSSEMYLTFLQSVRDMANRYVAVSMQEHALTEIVLSGTEKAQKVLETKDESADSQAQSIVMATAFRANRDDLAISDDSDADLIDLPKSPAELELNSEKAK